jgi:uncharacterized small protein (DUF1192 family)
MDIEDLEPRKVKPAPKDLAPLSVDDLHAYIAGLEAEIVRARAEIGARQSHRSAAESFFRR